MHQFHNKSVTQHELMSTNLLFYPILMATNVLTYHAHEVPMDEDQHKHIELMHDVTKTFNKHFNKTLIVPKNNIPKINTRVRNLQKPNKKISTTAKSPKNTIYINKNPNSLIKKFKSTQTNSNDEIRHTNNKPNISNLIKILTIMRTTTPKTIKATYPNSQHYSNFKTTIDKKVTE